MSKSADYARVWSLVGALVTGLAGCSVSLNFFAGAVAGAVTGAVIGATLGYYRDEELRKFREIHERERLEAAAILERERLEAAAIANASARAADLAKLKHVAAEVQRAVSSLSIILGKVEMALDRAQDELKSGLYSPFWEAIEGATSAVQLFDSTLSSIELKLAEYRIQAAQVGSDAPSLSIGVSVLPDPANTRRRLIALYREAQKDPHFAIVYEQRRTNAILIAGFRSLGQAIEGLGDRITDAIDRLSDSLDCRLVSLESSLESVAAVAREQSAALRTELQQSHDANEAVIHQLRQDAEARSEDGRLALRMLDNIQRGRKPTMWERP
jgi:hypothetical protein